MGENDNRDLLAAMAAELADIRAEIEAAGGLVSEVLRQLPAEARLGYLTRSQSFDVLSQRIEALSGLAQAVADDQPMDTAGRPAPGRDGRADAGDGAPRPARRGPDRGR